MAENFNMNKALKKGVKLKSSKAVKLNRKGLSRVIDAFVEKGPKPGYAAWKRECDKGVRHGKLDESSVDECIAYVCTQVQNQLDDDGNPETGMTFQELRKMSREMQKIASRYTQD